MKNIPEKESREPGLKPEKEKIGERVEEELYVEKKEELEKRELLSEQEKIVREKLEKEVELMDLDPELKQEAEKKAEQIKFLGKKGKLKRLLDLAEEKGVIFAVKVAKDMKDPYTLDAFHDILAREGLYKKFEE